MSFKCERIGQDKVTVQCSGEKVMKRKTTREILAESFRELAEKKNIDRITIKDITDNCGYSPATFYRQFSDKYDLIAWDYSQRIASIMDRVGRDGYVWKQTLIDAARVFLEEKTYLANLLMHTEGHDSFIRYMADINFESLKAHIRQVTGGEGPDEKTEWYIRIYCLGTVSLTCEWLMDVYDMTPEELAEVYENSVPDPLKPYLL